MNELRSLSDREFLTAITGKPFKYGNSGASATMKFIVEAMEDHFVLCRVIGEVKQVETVLQLHEFNPVIPSIPNGIFIDGYFGWVYVKEQLIRNEIFLIHEEKGDLS